jgi:hypothetical protein
VLFNDEEESTFELTDEKLSQADVSPRSSDKGVWRLSLCVGILPNSLTETRGCSVMLVVYLSCL